MTWWRPDELASPMSGVSASATTSGWTPTRPSVPVGPAGSPSC